MAVALQRRVAWLAGLGPLVGGSGGLLLALQVCCQTPHPASSVGREPAGAGREACFPVSVTSEARLASSGPFVLLPRLAAERSFPPVSVAPWSPNKQCPRPSLSRQCCSAINSPDAELQARHSFLERRSCNADGRLCLIGSCPQSLASPSRRRIDSRETANVIMPTSPRQHQPHGIAAQ